MNKADRVVSEMLDYRNLPPPKLFSSEADIDSVVKRPIGAIELAISIGHHPKLWDAVKNSTFARDYIKDVRGVPEDVKVEYVKNKEKKRSFY